MFFSGVNPVTFPLFLKPSDNIEKLFSQINLEGSWQIGRQLLNEPTIYGLQFCSDRLSRETSVSTANHEKIERIQQVLSEFTKLLLQRKISTRPTVVVKSFLPVKRTVTIVSSNYRKVPKAHN